MKTKKVSSIKMLVMSLIAMGAIFNTACGKKDSGGSAAGPGPAASPLGGCAAGACSGLVNPGLLASAGTTVSSGGIQIDFGMDFIGEQSRFNPTDPKAIITYVGPAALSGYIKISSTGASICGAAPGEYTMQASAQGTMQAVTLVNSKMISAAGPASNRIEATVQKAFVHNYQDPNLTVKSSPTNQLEIIIRFDSVNGQPCGALISTF